MKFEEYLGKDNVSFEDINDIIHGLNVNGIFMLMCLPDGIKVKRF